MRRTKEVFLEEQAGAEEVSPYCEWCGVPLTTGRLFLADTVSTTSHDHETVALCPNDAEAALQMGFNVRCA